MLRDRASRTLAGGPLIPSWFQEIGLITATDLLSLLTYHKKCADAVYALRFDLSWITSHYGSLQACSWMAYSGNCGCPRSTTPKYKLSILTTSLQWWEDFMEETFRALQDKPCKETVQATADKTVQTVKARNCQNCSFKITEGMRDFLELFTRKIDESISQIEVELNF
ncbi:hypothetical protein EV363DRAFT_1381192 [Boletus edulis]|nr:hypothetical protein EV363DRAFT_1381192 [Boletus edulis]